MKLHLHDPDGGSRDIPLDGLADGAPLVIGREAGSDIPLDRRGVSRKHCAVVRNGDGFLLRDLGSSNGTKLNGKPVQEAPLRPGDTFTVGTCTFTLVTGDGPVLTTKTPRHQEHQENPLPKPQTTNNKSEIPPKETERTTRRGEALELIQRRQKRKRIVTAVVLIGLATAAAPAFLYIQGEMRRTEIRRRLDVARRLQEDHRHAEALAAAEAVATDAADLPDIGPAVEEIRKEALSFTERRDGALLMHGELAARIPDPAGDPAGRLAKLRALEPMLAALRERYGAFLNAHPELRAAAETGDADRPLRDLVRDGVIGRRDGVDVRLADAIAGLDAFLREKTRERYEALRTRAEALAKDGKSEEALAAYQAEQPSFSGLAPYEDEIAARVKTLAAEAKQAGEARARREAARKAREALQAALSAADGLARDGRYAAAAEALRAVAETAEVREGVEKSSDDPGFIEVRNSVATRRAEIADLAGLQKDLIDAVSQGKATGPVTLAGAAPRKATAADADGVVVEGGAKVAWKNVPPGALADLGDQAGLAPERRLLLATICRDRGLGRRAGRILHEAVTARPELRDRGQQILTRWLPGASAPFEFRNDLGRWVPKGWAVPEVPREFRGVWVATVSNIDWPVKGQPPDRQKRDLIEILDRAVALRLNAIVFQVRPMADAFYDSKIEPWSEYLTGKQGKAPEPFWDPLAFAVDESHQRGLELHAWFNPYRATVGKTGELAPNHVSKKMPDVVYTYRQPPQLWMDPAAPEVQKQSLDVFLDVTRRYDVDAVHMDDYFYPYPESGVDFPDGKLWDKYVKGGGKLSRGDWRRKNVDDFVKNLAEQIRKVKPHVRLGISPFGIWKPGHPKGVVGLNQYEAIFADARKWLVEGWVDYLAPQLYWPIESKGQPFPALLRWWKEQSAKGRPVWPGLNTSLANNNDETRRQIEEVRKVCGDDAGHIHFSERTLRRNTGGSTDRLRETVYAKSALPPALPWLGKGKPAALKARIAAVKPDAIDVAVAAGSLAPDVRWWVVQVERAGAWDHAILPAARDRATVPLPGKDGLPDSVYVFAVDRAGVAGDKTVVELPAADVQ